jgi:acyl carrier protein
MDQKELIRMVELQLGHPGVKPGDRFAEDLAAESIDMLHIVADVEDHTGMHIPEEALPDIRTVQDLFDYIESHLPV